MAPQPSAGVPPAAAARGAELGTAWAFRALGLSRDATRADAKRAYHRCAVPAALCGQGAAHCGITARLVAALARAGASALALSATPRPWRRSVLKTAHPDKGGDAAQFLQVRARAGAGGASARGAAVRAADATPTTLARRRQLRCAPQAQSALQAVLQDLERATAREWDWRHGCATTAAAALRTPL
jgi:hypothetical protein